jgi:hypothetical protein
LEHVFSIQLGIIIPTVTHKPIVETRGRSTSNIHQPAIEILGEMLWNPYVSGWLALGVRVLPPIQRIQVLGEAPGSNDTLEAHLQVPLSFSV